MTTLSLPGTWCGDCTPAGSWVALYPQDRPDPRIQTSRGRVELPGQNVLTLVCADIGSLLCFAGSGGTDDVAQLWNGARWIPLVKTYGTSPCAFGPFQGGTALFVSCPLTASNVKVFDPLSGAFLGAITQPIGGRGFASVDARGIHPQDAWYGHHGLGEYVEVEGYRIGQGTTVDGLKVADFGMLIPGPPLCQFNRVHMAGDQFAVASWLPQYGRTEFLWPTVADLATLPPEAAPPEPPDPTPEPEPEPTPPPLRDPKYWLAPNIQTTDVLALFDGDVPNVGEAGVFQLYVQEILNLGNTGPNTYEAFVAKDAFRKLRKHGIALSIECGAVKPGNCQASDSIAGITEAVRRVRAAGGDVTHVSMDEPLVGAEGCLGQALSKTADYTAKFITATRALGVASVGWIEAWPHVSLSSQQTFFQMLVDRGATPSFWHMDIDWRRADKEGKSPAAYIAQVTATAQAHGIEHAVILVSTDDPQPSDAAWFTNVKALTRRVRSIQDLPRAVVQSWTTRTGDGQTVPATLGTVGLLASLADAVAVFGAPLPPPDPEPIPPDPQPPTPGALMLKAYGPVMPGFLPGNEHDNGDGTISVQKPNGKWLCVTPEGRLEERDSPGGLWESFKKGKGCLIAERDGGARGPVVYVLSGAETL